MVVGKNGYTLAFLAGIGWGTIGIISYYLGKTGIGPFEVAFLRLFFAFLIMFLFYFITDKEKVRIEKKEFKHAILIGVISQGVMSLAMYKCISMTSTTVGIMMVCLGPLFTALLSRIFFSEKITLFKGLALFLALYGASLVVTGGNFSKLQTNGAGLLVGLLSALAFGSFPILRKKIPEELNFTGILMYSFLIGSIFTFPMLDIKILLKTFSLNTIIFSILLGLIPTVFSYTIYSMSLKFITPTKASIISLVELPAAAIIGHFFLREYLVTISIIGIIILLAGITISKIEIPRRRNIFKTKY